MWVLRSHNLTQVFVASYVSLIHHLGDIITFCVTFHCKKLHVCIPETYYSLDADQSCTLLSLR